MLLLFHVLVESPLLFSRVEEEEEETMVAPRAVESSQNGAREEDPDCCCSRFLDDDDDEMRRTDDDSMNGEFDRIIILFVLLENDSDRSGATRPWTARGDPIMTKKSVQLRNVPMPGMEECGCW
mmetsp:Transcript_20175/g.55701  ORF Transcript_20175/g.55701 Transcript_20175/m.55701 type:complete len:124 (-) Transcript_20175:693-1064(-)